MKLIIFFIGIFILKFISCRNYGFHFHQKNSYIQTIYSLLCNESSVKLELLIDGTTGVILFAENKKQSSSVLVYMKRPGVYMNITLGLKKFDVAFTLDFFNNEWNGWHDIEMKISKTRFGFLFDGNLKEAVINEEFLFPEKDIEENNIYFGSELHRNKKYFPGFYGFMRNFQYKSCGCDQWKPVKFIKSQGISFDNLGDCNTNSTCPSKCSCLLFNWGGMKCDCAGLTCPKTDDDVYYGFDDKQRGWFVGNQLVVVDKTENLNYGVGITGESLKFDSGQYIVLSVLQGMTCFKNVFFCENEFYYQFWLKPLFSNGYDGPFEILKHSTTEQSIYGLIISRIENIFEFAFVTNQNQQFKLESFIPPLKWIRITLSFNQTHFQLFLNSELTKSTDKFKQISEVLPSSYNTKYLFIGKTGSKSNMEIDQFHFSTNSSILKNPSIEEFIVEQYENSRTINTDCNSAVQGQLVNVTNCYLNMFQKSNFSWGFYVSLIFSVEAHLQFITILESSIISLVWIGKDQVELRLFSGTKHEFMLKQTRNNLYYLEISIDPDKRLSVFQDIVSILFTTSFDYKISSYISNGIYMLINGNSYILRLLKILNVNKELGLRALRIPTNKEPHYSEDFDNLDQTMYSSLKLSKSYIGNGIEVKSQQPKVTLSIFRISCIKSTKLCYSGITVSFWFKWNGNTNINKLLFNIFSTGETGMTLVIDSENNFILIMENMAVKKFFSHKILSYPNKWFLFELTISSNKIASMFIDDIELRSVVSDHLSVNVNCLEVCIGDENYAFDNNVLHLDEINVWDIDRNFLYANNYLSKKISPHKLYSFTIYQLSRDIIINGSAKLISTKYGQGVSLNGFGSRFAISKPINFSSCFLTIDSCRRGIMIRLFLRIDNLAINHQVFMSNSRITVGSNLERLFVRLLTNDRLWVFISKDILQVFMWQTILISWRLDNGMKVFLNGDLIGHVLDGTESEYRNSYDSSVFYFGKAFLPNSTDYATVIIDDVELYEADRYHLSFERLQIDKISCVFRYSFDKVSGTNRTVQLGIVGNAGLYNSNASTGRKIEIPHCFNEYVADCRGCLALRFWLHLGKLNISILQARNVKILISINKFVIDIDSQTFLCSYNNKNLLNNWNFFELSWDIDEGLLIFINRELLYCVQQYHTKNHLVSIIGIEISNTFNGLLDELEIFSNRLSNLYWNKVINEDQLEKFLLKLRDNKKFQKEMLTLAKISKHGNTNITVKHIQSFEFNGSNYLEFKIPTNLEPAILGGMEEIEISFQSHDSVASSIIWISDGQQSKSILFLKNHKLYFTKVYLLSTTNGTKRISEELEIYQNIKPYVIYNLKIYQKSGEYVMKIHSLYESSTQTMIGRDALMPENSNVYFGGYKKGNFSEFSMANSSFIGIIYKARIKSVLNSEPVDIIQEMAAVKSNPNIINHGNVKVVMKTAEISLLSKASFLGTLIDRKMSLTISNPLVSIILPKWDFELFVCFEIEFSTLESQGLVVFIGNSTHFVAVEIFDSKLYFVYKLSESWNRVTFNGSNNFVNHNNLQNVYFGRDLSGNLKVFFNKKEVLESLQIPREFANSSSIIGHFGSYELWPPEIISRIGFIGCIHFVAINDIEYLNFSRWITPFNRINDHFGLTQQLDEMFDIGKCVSPKTSSCSTSPCQGGWCQPTSISAFGKYTDNYRCNCLYSSKSLDNNFSGSSEVDNFNSWIRNHLLQSRSKPCTEETPQILIIENSFLTIKFKIQFPFVSVFDVDFMILMKRENGCLVRVSDNGLDMLEIIVVKRLLIVRIPNKAWSVKDITINDNQWHGIHLKVRFGLIHLKIDNMEQILDTFNFMLPSFTRLSIGQCSDFKESNFRLKNFLYNNLNILQNLYQTSSFQNLFYSAEYSYPSYHSDKPKSRNQITDYPLTLLNNFNTAWMQDTIKLSWLNEIEFQLTVFHPGSFVHLINKDKFLSLIFSDQENGTFIYKDGYLNSERVKISFEKNVCRIKIELDLLKGILKYTLNSKTTNVISNKLFSWNIGDDLQIVFGMNNNTLKQLTIENIYYLQNDFFNIMSKSYVGCVHNFIVKNDKTWLDINRSWSKAMQTLPQISVLYGQCLSIQKCHPNYCVNGICRSHNFTNIFCDCSRTKFIGSRCHIPKLYCSSDACKNNGICVENENVCKCDNTGYTGAFCEVPECQSNFCLNGGQCHLINNIIHCNCTTTGFTGNRCEQPTCIPNSCSGKGICTVHSTLNVRICHCKVGFFGDTCEMDGYKKCSVDCQNEGVCSPFNPVVKLCSGAYCEVSQNFSCSCDHTRFRGKFCETPEFGFIPKDDGLVVMNKLTTQNVNYLRILFQVFSTNQRRSLLYMEYNEHHFFNLIVDGQYLWLYYVSVLDRNEMKSNIGKIEDVNILLLTENTVEINFYFNLKIGILSLNQSFANNIRRQRADTNFGSYHPKIILGAGRNHDDIFDGIISGVRWNDRIILDPLNDVIRSNALASINQLRTRPFPYYTPHLMSLNSPNLSLIHMLIILLAIQSVQVLFYILRRRKATCKHSKIEVHKEQYFALVHTSQVDSEQTDVETLLKSEKIEEDWIATMLIPPESYIVRSASVILTKNIRSIHDLMIMDILIIPGTNDIAMLIDQDREFQADEILFPLDGSSKEYNCISLHASKDYRYAYCHAKRNSLYNRNLVELLVWEVKEKWKLICQPPNIEFNSSHSIPGSSSNLLLTNFDTSTLFIWNLDLSMVVWKSILSPLIILDDHLITPSYDARHIILSHEDQLQIIVVEADSNQCQIMQYDLPFFSRCLQFIPLGKLLFLIRTKSKDIYIFNSEEFTLNKMLNNYKIVLISQFERESQISVALGMDTGEIYLTDDIGKSHHFILGPKNKSPIVCIQFSSNGHFLCAGYENNMIHVWRIIPDICLCHFHAIHESRMLRELYFVTDDRYIIACFPVPNSGEKSTTERTLRLINRSWLC